MSRRGFASDNNSGVHPEIMKAIINANEGHTMSYGEDVYSERAKAAIRKHFGEETEIFFVLTGTAANILSLKSAVDSFNSVICAETAHINVDECAAPEKNIGCKIYTIPTPDGKLTPALIKPHLHGFGSEHHAQPKIISISTPTELGTVFTLDEIKAIADLAHQHGMYLHIDGARLANAAASLGTDMKSITVDAGADVVSLGGTKNGLMYGEAVLIFNKDLALNFKYKQKQSMQLVSKMRFVSAQFEAYLKDDLWLRIAQHANKMAAMLGREIEQIPQIKITQKVQSNGVFAVLPGSIIAELQEKYPFYYWDENISEVRWLTSFDTTEEDIRNFVVLIKELICHKGL